MDINNLLQNLSGQKDPFAGRDPAYRKKYIHPIPAADVVQREKYILAQCTDKVVMDIGCGNSLHEKIQKLSKKAYGIDVEGYDFPNFHKCDVTIPDEFSKLVFTDVELILCCDIIEHLSNPGVFLDTLKKMYPNTDKIICAPNFQAGFFKDYVKVGHENVNPEHVAYYSYHTLNNLLVRHKLEIKEFHWYENANNYPQGFNEGVLFIAT